MITLKLIISTNLRGVERKIKDFYLEKIEKKKNFVENKGEKFRFLELKLTRKQQQYVFANVA